MSLIEMFKLLVEVCGFERTIIGILLVVTFYLVTILTAVLLFKYSIMNIKKLVEECGGND